MKISSPGRILLLAAMPLVCMAAGCGTRPLPQTLVHDSRVVEEIRDIALVRGPAQQREEVQVADPTGFAKVLKGRVILDGAPPSYPPLVMDKDTAVCGAGGRDEGRVQVGADGGLKNVLIYLSSDVPADNSKWVHESYAETAGATVEFDQKACLFLDRIVTMRSTQTLKILNSDPVPHNTKLDTRGGAAAFNPVIPANSHTFYQPGGAEGQPFPVSCSIHPWMSSNMIVRDNPYFAKTDENGNFTIEYPPSGVELEFRLWHEAVDRGGFLTSVTLNGARESLRGGKKTVTLNADDEVTWNIALDAAEFN